MAEDKMTALDWARKDKLIARESAMKSVAMAYDGQNVNSDVLIEEANKIYDWIAQDQTWEKEANTDTPVVSDISHPTPTQPQLEALKKVENETGWTASQVYAKFQRFPDMSNYKACINCIKEGE